MAAAAVVHAGTTLAAAFTIDDLALAGVTDDSSVGYFDLQKWGWWSRDFEVSAHYEDDVVSTCTRKGEAEGDALCQVAMPSLTCALLLTNHDQCAAYKLADFVDFSVETGIPRTLMARKRYVDYVQKLIATNGAKHMAGGILLKVAK